MNTTKVSGSSKPKPMMKRKRKKKSKIYFFTVLLVKGYKKKNKISVISKDKQIKKYCEKYHIQYMMKVGIKEPFNIQHYAPNEGYRMWHCERSTSQSLQRALAWMTYLNDVDDGGETEFHWQQLKVKPVKGKTVIWPTDFTHLHRGITSPTQHKYIVTGWFSFFDAIDVEREFTNFINKSKELSETYKMITGT